MLRKRAFLVAALAAACGWAGGCYITPTDVKPAVDAKVVTDEVKPAPGAAPTDKQLKPIESVVVVPFLYDTWEQDKPKIECLPARRVAQGDSVPYPFHIHVSPILQPDRWLAQGVLVFAKGCWPVAFTQNYSGGPSRWESPFVVWLVLNAKGTLRTRLYPASRPFGEDVYHAGKAECAELILRDHLPNVFASVDDAPALTQADREMVYKSLSAYLEAAWKVQTDPEAKKIWVRARQALREKLVLLAVPNK